MLPRCRHPASPRPDLSAAYPCVAQVLIPLLDAIQHGPDSTVAYSYEEDGAVLVARACGSHPAETELVISYGEHPDFIFGLHYGFVPALFEQRASCYTVLKLMGAEGATCVGDGMGLGLGAPIALSAQRAAEELQWERASDETALDWREDEVAANPLAALADFLSWRGVGVDYPLQFGVSADALDALSGQGRAADADASPAAADDDDDHHHHVPVPVPALDTEGGFTDLRSLALCARLCALRDDGSGDSDEAQQQRALLQLLRMDSLGPLNDADAARLVSAAAREQLTELQAARTPSLGARAVAVEMASSLRTSEGLVLGRMCDTGDVGLLFGVRG